MKFRILAMLAVLALITSFGWMSEAANNQGLIVVGLYSETAAGSVSYRVGGGNWVVIKVGDQISNNAEIMVNVDRDWVEVCPANNPNAVYELAAPEGKVTKKVADILKEKPKTVNFPKAGEKADPKFANKVVVKQYLGRQIYTQKKPATRQDIKYGDILDATGSVTIIAINHTLDLILPNGKANDQIVGPIKFTVEDVLKKKNLYKYLNVTK